MKHCSVCCCTVLPGEKRRFASEGAWNQTRYKWRGYGEYGGFTGPYYIIVDGNQLGPSEVIDRLLALDELLELSAPEDESEKGET